LDCRFGTTEVVPCYKALGCAQLKNLREN